MYEYRIRFHLQSTGTNIKVYSQPAPSSTDRVVAIGGKPNQVVDAVATIIDLLETVSNWEDKQNIQNT